MSGILITPGDVVRLKLPDSDPPGRNKFCLCVCVAEGLFFIINTNPFHAAPKDSQIVVYQSEMEFLRYDSFLDASSMKKIPPEAVQAGQKQARPAESTIKRLKQIIAFQRYLPKWQIKLLEQNWP